MTDQKKTDRPMTDQKKRLTLSRPSFQDKREVDLSEIKIKLDERLGERYDHDEAKVARMRKIFSVVTLVGMAIAVGLVIYGWRIGLFSDAQKVQDLLRRAGFWGPFLFILLQIFQCVFPIIPGGVTSLIGVYMFGAFNGFFLNFIGIYIGQIIIFLLARWFGIMFVRSLVSEKNYEKYSKWLDEKQERIDRFFIVTMILPGMPDDIICMLMGLTQMSFRYYAFHLAWTRVPALLLYTLFLDRAFTSGGAVLEWIKQRLFH